MDQQPPQGGYPQQPPSGYYQQPPFPNQQPLQGHPPQYQQPPKKSRAPIIIVIALGAILLFCGLCGVVVIAGSHNSNTGTLTSGTGTTVTSAPTDQHFKPGDQVNVGDTWQITVSQPTTSQGGQFDTPKPGDTYLLILVSFKNVSAKEQSLFGNADWTLKDLQGQKYDPAYITDASPPDGKIEEGSPAKGTLAYEVPSGTKAFQLSFEISMFQSGQTIWDLSV